jgi:hypothetical protein
MPTAFFVSGTHERLNQLNGSRDDCHCLLTLVRLHQTIGKVVEASRESRRVGGEVVVGQLLANLNRATDRRQAARPPGRSPDSTHSLLIPHRHQISIAPNFGLLEADQSKN